MKAELIARFEAIRMDCSKCPIPEADCKWVMDTFANPIQWEVKPSGKADKWCPLLITMGNVLAFMLPDK